MNFNQPHQMVSCHVLAARPEAAPQTASVKSIARKTLSLLLAVGFGSALSAQTATAQSVNYYITGAVGNVASNSGGLQVYMGGKVPLACNQSGLSWMMIPLNSSNSYTLMNEVMMAAASGAQVNLYTDGSITTYNSTNYCTIVQVVSALR